jgi:hypothetical protein
MQYDSLDSTHHIDFYIGSPKSGKTTIAGTYPKPMLWVSVGNDGGGKVLKGIDGIKAKILKNDLKSGGKIAKSSVEYLADLLAELRKPNADQFKTIVIDIVGALQDDYQQMLETNKGGKALNEQEWGDISKMMQNIKEIMKRYSEDKNCILVWVDHIKQMEMYETSGLSKEIRIIPTLTKKTGARWMKDAMNVFYVCRKTFVDKQGNKQVKFATYVGPHPLTDTGTREMKLALGDFVLDFTYPKWQEMIKKGELLDTSTPVLAEPSEEVIDEDTNKED